MAIKVKKLIIDLNDINQSVKNVNRLKKSFEYFGNDIVNYQKEFIQLCLDFVKQKSMQYLDEVDYFTPSQISDIRTNINQITITENNNSGYTLSYDSEVVSFIEFGTGRVGKRNPHPMANDNPKYKYASGQYSSRYGVWFWINREYGMTKKVKTKGYEGRKFIYRAFRDLIDLFYEDKAVEMMERLINKYF